MAQLLSKDRAAKQRSMIDMGKAAQSDVPGLPDDGYRVDFADAGIDADVARDSGGALGAKHFLVHSVGVATGGASADLEADILVVRNAAGAVVRAERSYWRRLDLD